MNRDTALKPLFFEGVFNSPFKKRVPYSFPNSDSGRLNSIMFYLILFKSLTFKKNSFPNRNLGRRKYLSFIEN
jgi:hypothetical protein